MSEASESIQDCEDCIDPAEAFSVIANDTRLSILEALWRAEERPVSFSDLRKAVGMRDSAQFNYHLSKLTDQFVKKVDGGYDFQHAGRAVISAVQSGSLHEKPRVEPFAVPGDCIDCGGDLVACYNDEKLRVSCGDCGRLHAKEAFPPGGLDGRSREEVVSAFDQRVRHLGCLAHDGVCPDCNGRMETSVAEAETMAGLDVVVHHDCQRCRKHMVTSVGLVLLDHADLVTFYREHGTDLNDRQFWTLEWVVSDRHTTVESTDPWRIRLDVPLDDETLTYTLDGDLDVLEVRRDHDPEGEDAQGLV